MDYIGLAVFCQYNNPGLNTLHGDPFIRIALSQKQFFETPSIIYRIIDGFSLVFSPRDRSIIEANRFHQGFDHRIQLRFCSAAT